MGKGRLEAFSDGVIANALPGRYTITATATNPALATKATFTLTNTIYHVDFPLITK